MSAKNYDLWIHEDCVLTVSLDKSDGLFRPDPEQQVALNSLVRDLAIAQKSCVYAALNDTSSEVQMQLDPIVAIANAIVVLTQLSAAIQDQLESEVLEEAGVES